MRMFRRGMLLPQAVRKFPETHGDTGADVKPLKEVLLTKETIMQAQSKDRFCQQICQAWKEGENIPYFRDKDSVLYRRNSGASGKLTVVVPVSLREQVLYQHHNPVFAGHQEEKRTLSSLRLVYYWPSMTKDMEEFVQKCTSCARIKEEGPHEPL